MESAPHTDTEKRLNNDVIREADEHLLARLRAREPAAFTELVNTAGGRMLSVARRMLTIEEDARDAVQEAFLSCHKHLDRFDGRSLLTTWLHRITVNVCLMRLRTRQRKPERSIEGLLPEFLADGHQTPPFEGWKPSDEFGIETSDLKGLIRGKINELPDMHREVLMLRDIEQLSTEETAEVLQISTNAVKTRLHRARQALMTLLSPLMKRGGEA